MSLQTTPTNNNVTLTMRNITPCTRTVDDCQPKENDVDADDVHDSMSSLPPSSMSQHCVADTQPFSSPSTPHFPSLASNGDDNKDTSTIRVRQIPKVAECARNPGSTLVDVPEDAKNTTSFIVSPHAHVTNAGIPSFARTASHSHDPNNANHISFQITSDDTTTGSANGIPAVVWKNQTYWIHERTWFRDCDRWIDNFLQKSRIEISIASARKDNDSRHVQSLLQFKDVYVNFLKDIHAHHFTTMMIKCQPRDAQWGIDEMIYLIGYKSTMQGETCFPQHCKIGQTQRGHVRIHEQSHTMAALLMTIDDTKELVSEELLDSILELNLPGMARHQDHVESGKNKIRLQLCEGLLASESESTTTIILETLVQIKNSRVNDTSHRRGTIPETVRGFLRDIGPVDCIFTWPTIISWLQSHRDDGELLMERLKDPPEGQFVKLYLVQRILGSKFGSWTDAIDRPPRVDQIDNAIVTPILSLMDDGITPSKQTIASLLLAIRGKENYNSYVRPDEKSLADGVKRVLSIKLADNTNRTIMIERCSMDALRRFHPEWLDSVISMESTIPFHSIQYCRGKENYGLRRIIITPSFFVMFAETARTTNRLRAVRGALDLVDCLVASGNKPINEAERFRDVMIAFLMQIENLPLESTGRDDLGFLGGRVLACPKGYFVNRSTTGIMTVSAFLRIGYAETLYLRWVLGAKVFGMLLRVHGLPAHSPLEIDWTCPGLPAAGAFTSTSCMADPASKGETYACIVGGNNVAHPFYGYICCNKCHGSFRSRARSFLYTAKENPHTENLTKAQQDLLDELDANAKLHVKRNNRYERRITQDEEGKKEFLDKKRVYKRTFQAKVFQDTQKRQAKCEYMQQHYKKQKTEGTTPPRSKNRRQRTLKTYPDPVMNDLREAIRQWILLVWNTTGDNFVNVMNLQWMMDEILQRHKDIIPRYVEMQVDDKGTMRPKYQIIPYNALLDEYFEPKSGPNDKNRHVKGKFKTQLSINASEKCTKPKKALYREEMVKIVLDRMFPTTAKTTATISS